MIALFFTVDESAALMREVYPNYPDLRDPRPAPQDLAKWLENYRHRKTERLRALWPSASSVGELIKPPAGLDSESS
jgi:hypothetical protein